MVEVKLSTNSTLVKGYTRQLEAYERGEKSAKGYYLVIDVGRMGNKQKRLIALKNHAAMEGSRVSPIIFVDGKKRKSASRL